jgi:hypothetical protein
LGGVLTTGAEVLTVFTGKSSFETAKTYGMCCPDERIKQLQWLCSTVNTTSHERVQYCRSLNAPNWRASLLPIAAPLTFAAMAYLIAKKYINSHESEESNALLSKASLPSSRLFKKITDVCTSSPARVGYAITAVGSSTLSLFAFWGASLMARKAGECGNPCLATLQGYAEWDTIYTISTIAPPVAITALVAANTYNKLKIEPASTPIPNPLAEQL